jgi:hypothetical protein
MESARDITAAIRSYLSSELNAGDTPLGEKAAIYADLCRQANERLRRCAAYLQQGRRTEAIHLAEVNPDLLERINDLDLPEFAQWIGMCTANGFESPPRLLTEVAAQINDAYAAEADLAPLLKKQRAMALAGSPLWQRLDVQRALVAADPNHPTWDRDLQAYEQARVAELAQEAQEAYDAADARGLYKVLQQLTVDEWSITVPAEQIEGVRRQYREVEVVIATQALHEIMPKLDEAYIAMAEVEAAQLVQQWQSIVTQHKLDVPVELQERLEPIVDWLLTRQQAQKRQQVFAQACGALGAAIDRNAPLEELKALYDACGHGEHPLPEDLQRRFDQAVADQRLASMRRRRITLLIATPIVAAVLLSIGWFVREQLDTHQAKMAAEQLQSLTDAGNLQRGAALLARLESRSPRLLSYESLSDARDAYESARSARQAQRYELAGLIADLEEKVEAAESVDGEWVTGVNRQLVQARSLNELAADPNLATRLGDVIQSALPLVTAWQARIDTEFQQRLQTWAEEKFQSLDTAQLDSDPERFAAQVAQLQRELNVLALTPHVSREAQSPLVYYQKSLGEYAAALAQRSAARDAQQEARGALEAALEVASVPSRYVQRLQEAAALQADSARASDFANAAQYVQHWEATLRWEALLQQWRGRVFPEDVDELSDRLATVQRLRNGNPAGYQLPGERALADELRRAEQALGPRGVWRSAYSDYLRSTPAIADLCVIRDQVGQMYYTDCDTEFTRVSGGLAGTVYTRLDLTGLDRRVIDIPQTAPARQQSPQPSPQTILADDLLGEVAQLSGSNWRGIGLELAEMIRERGGVDSVLRVAMLDRTLEGIERTVPVVSTAVRSIRDSIAALGVLDVDWVAPNNPEADNARRIASEFLTHLSLDKLSEQLNATAKRLNQQFAYTPAGYGIALVEQNGWTILTRLPPREGAIARVVVPDPLTSGTELRQIAVATSSGFQIKPPDMVGVTEGSLVFIWRPIAPANQVTRGER